MIMQDKIFNIQIFKALFVILNFSANKIIQFISFICRLGGHDDNKLVILFTKQNMCSALNGRRVSRLGMRP